MAEEAVLEAPPKIISVRGGTSKKAIVRRIPPELAEKSLEDAIQYATRPSELKNDEEKSVADSIRQVQRGGEYILVINGIDSVTAEKIKEEVLSKYIKTQSRDLEGGERAQFGLAEIAVASVQEGGYKTLDYKL